MARTRFFLVVAIALVLVPHLGAQTTGSIRGHVTDAEGGVLADATLTLHGEALLGDRVVRSGNSGSYLLNLLPPGLYEVQVELDGFQSQVAEAVRVRLNTATAIDFKLLSTFTEEVIISGEVPLVDLMSSSLASNYSADFLDALPTGREFWETFTYAPGISSNITGEARPAAFGSGLQSSAWQIDGLAADSPKFGSGWWYLNPDTIEEVQILGVGAPAEFGNMLGAVFNVVTKSGGNDLSGTLNLLYQDKSLSDDDPEIDEIRDYVLTLGGPLKKDKVWYFLSGQYYRKTIEATQESDRFDVKISSRFKDRFTLDLKYHLEDWTFPQAPDPNFGPDAHYLEVGTNPAWGLNLTTVLSESSFLEVKYSGWWGDDLYHSATGSTDPPNLDLDTGFYSGGLAFPRDFENGRDQVDAAVSHFADELLGGTHDFKFGVQYTTGYSDVLVAPGWDGSYLYSFTYAGNVYRYNYFRNPYLYGSDNESLSAFADDSWQVNDRLTLNIGVRFDHHEGVIPDYARVDGERQPTSEITPGSNALEWDDATPRFGFAYTTAAGRGVVRGSFGVYTDGSVGANWDFPPPGLPPSQSFAFNPATEAYDILLGSSRRELTGTDPDLRAPRATQFALGYEHQLGSDYSLGAQVIYKEEKDFVGWEVGDDGVYEEVLFTDPFTGTTYTLLDAVVAPSIRKGNSPGFRVDGADRYYSEYEALILTFNKRYSRGWSLSSSYTYSESRGRTPKPFSAFHLSPLLRTLLGSDPNQTLNSDQLLQADRPHMFRVQASFELPWDLRLSTILNLQSGRPYNRQINVVRSDDGARLSQGTTRIILDAASDDVRYSSQSIVDLTLGKHFKIRDVTLKLDARVLNVLDDDAVDRWSSLVLSSPARELSVRTRLEPRRIMLRLGIEF